MKVGDEEYKSRLKQFFEKHGPPDGTGMIASWGWHLKKERELKKLMTEIGELEPKAMGESGKLES